jgi:N-acetylmuramoyl-L-alanine amidase
MTVLSVLAAPPNAAIRKEYLFKKQDASEKSTLTTSVRDGQTYVSVKQFCFSLSCRVVYRWADHKAVIENPRTRTSAIVSSVAHLALVDGRVIEFEGKILSEIREGYLLPVSLAAMLAERLKLGRIEVREIEAPVVARHVTEFNRVVIDPGHGGNDLGTGLGSILEKDVALFYALKLRDELKREMPDLEIVLTRDGDRYVSLADRAKLANESGAHFFLSLHVNHAPNTKIEGVETYILNPEATDDDARKLALLENDEWLKSSGIKGGNNIVQKILVDVEQTKYIQESAFAASLIQSELLRLDGTHGLKSRGVKQAMFYVLSQVAMPSTLVEMGFLSNTGDRGRLMNIDFRDQFVSSVVNALKKYREQKSERSGGAGHHAHPKT